jgi:hypothetical protein
MKRASSDAWVVHREVNGPWKNLLGVGAHRSMEWSAVKPYVRTTRGGASGRQRPAGPEPHSRRSPDLKLGESHDQYPG